MSLRRRLVAGMLLLLVLGVVVTDVLTRSELRSYLYGRLDEQNDVTQSQAYDYIEAVYNRALAAGDHNASANPGMFLTQLAVPSSSPLSLSTASLGPSAPAPVSSGIPAALAQAEVGQVPRTARLNPSVLADRLSPDIYVEVLDSSGQVLFRRPSGSADAVDPVPVLPRPLAVSRVPPTARFGHSHGPYLPVQQEAVLDVKGLGSYYYGEAVAVPGGVLVTAAPIAPTQQTLASLTRVELLVSVVVLVVLLVLVLWTVRLGLRPLEDMTDTARAIAAGDLRRRIRRADDRSEVGRLGAALNGMLTQIEAAFSERTASEGRLRRFVADASHELRTPLTSIRGYAELLRKGALDDDAERRRAAERIEHEATRMSLLVDDLLLLARLDQGRPLDLSPVDLSELLARAVESAGAADAEHPITLRSSGGVEVEGDAARLRHVIDNLLHNAQVHTPAGTPVRAEVLRRGEHAELVVADQGPGVGPDEAERVFDRFYRSRSARGRPGTGLGLSIVAGLAEAHGGRAFARPGSPRGVEFVVELPLAGASRPGHRPPAPAGDQLAIDGRVPAEDAAPPGSTGGVPGDGTMAPHGPRVGEPSRR